MHKAVAGVEKADIEEARQALKRALEKGTSVAFRKIEKEGAQQWVEAGGSVKCYANHDQLEGQQAVWRNSGSMTARAARRGCIIRAWPKILSQSVSRRSGELPEALKQARQQSGVAPQSAWASQ